MRTIPQILAISLMFSFSHSFSQNIDNQYVDEVAVLGTTPDIETFIDNVLIENSIEAVIPKDYIQLSAYDMNYIGDDTLFLVLSDSDMEFLPEYSFGILEGIDTIYAPGNLYHRGFQDGRLFYRNKGTFWGAFGVGFVTPYTYFIPGLAVGGIMAGIGPNERNLRYHDTRMLYDLSGASQNETNELFNDINYSRGYKKGAHNKKLGNVAGGFGAGLGSGILVGVIVLVSLLNVMH